jgi:hypothetical protein
MDATDGQGLTTPSTTTRTQSQQATGHGRRRGEGSEVSGGRGRWGCRCGGWCGVERGGAGEGGPVDQAWGLM